jgi:hypothetical protein
MSYREFAVAGALALMVSMPAMAADKPTDAEIKAVVEKSDLGKDKDFTWHSVLSAAPRKASIGEISSAGLPPSAVIVPVKVDYTEDTGGGWVRDHVQNYYFFKDDFGAWSAQATSMPGNSTSEPHRKK